MNKNEPMQLPEIEPMPPMTTMSRISYVMADLNVLAWTVVWYIASSAPEMPAKNEEMMNAMRFVVGKVDAHGLGGDLIIADGLEGAAVGRS